MILPSEELELKIYRFAEAAGKAMWRPTDLPTLSNIAQFHEHAVLVDALLDLQSRKLIEFRQWSNERSDWVLCTGDNRNYFYRAFEVRVTFSGRKYFERLEAQFSAVDQSAQTEIRLQGIVQGAATVRAELDSSPQAIVPPPIAPKAFVSHSGQDRHFVEKFAADLWDFGVKAWYSRWEIKAGDSIPERIDEGIEDCEFFIIVLSKNSIHAVWVKTELQAAITRKLDGKVRKIIPIKIDDCDQFPPIIGSLYREDFTTQSYEAALKRVVNSIFGVDERPALGKRPTEHEDEGTL